MRIAVALAATSACAAVLAPPAVAATTGGVSAQAIPPSPAPGAPLVTLAGSRAQASATLPMVVRRVIWAGNRLQKLPYRYGGGHASFKDTAYDCSGTVSYALHGGGLLALPLDSTGLSRWGVGGRGKWITVYANKGHAFMIVAGLRLDTSGTGGAGPRWQTAPRSTAGFVARHPAGL